MKRSALLLASVFALALLAAGCSGFSLAADVTPPPDYVTPTPVPTFDLAAAVPSAPPDLARGGMLFMENCAPCHGIAGMGDGPQAGNLPVPVPALASPAEVRASRPLDWYQVLVAGRMDRYMPPFNSLDQQQKWDVLAYVYSLGVSPDMLAEGKQVFADQCAACHGPSGQGDGPRAAGLSGKLTDWTNPASLVGLSQQELTDITAQGKGEMPAFQGKLSPDQLNAVAAFIQQLGVAPLPQETPAPADAAQAPSPAAGGGVTAVPAGPAASETPAAAGLAAIHGAVTNASGGVLPTGLKAVLEAYDAMQAGEKREAEVGADGSFQWDDVEVQPNRVYLVSVDYQGTTFRSKVIHATDLKPGQVFSAPIEVYDTTSDTAGLKVERLHIFFEFSKPDRVQVVEMALVSNTGKKMVAAPEPGKAVLAFDLPKGYENLQFQDGQIGDRYVQTATGFGDTAGIQPGNAAHQELFAYELPYKDSAVLTLHAPLDVASATLMLPQSGVSLEGEGLQDGGERTLQEGVLHIYTASNLKAGSTLELTLSGRPGQASAFTANTKSELLIGLGVLILALVGTAFWLMKRKDNELEAAPSHSGQADTVDSLLDAIVALDDLYKAGSLTKKAWEERRAELKEHLRQVKEQEG